MHNTVDRSPFEQSTPLVDKTQEKCALGSRFGVSGTRGVPPKRREQLRAQNGSWSRRLYCAHYGTRACHVLPFCSESYSELQDLYKRWAQLSRSPVLWVLSKWQDSWSVVNFQNQIHLWESWLPLIMSGIPARFFVVCSCSDLIYLTLYIPSWPSSFSPAVSLLLFVVVLLLTRSAFWKM